MELKCSLCHRDFDEFERVPRIIPQCGHSYCEKCLRNAIQERRNVFTCPIDGKTHMFRKDPAQVSKNMIVLKAIGEQRQQVLAKSRSTFAKQYETETANFCEQHQKPCEFRCINDGKLVCAHCAIFGQHKGHELESAGKLAESETQGLADGVKKELEKLQCCIKEILEPPGSLTKQIERVKKDLRIQIKEIFKAYHETISRKEAYMEKEVDNIVKQQGHLLKKMEDELEQNLKTSRLIREQAHTIIEDIPNNPNRVVAAEAKNIIDRITSFKPSLLKLDEDIKGRCQEISHFWKLKLKQVEYFKIQQLFPTFVEADEKLRGKSTKFLDDTQSVTKTECATKPHHQGKSKTPMKNVYSVPAEKAHTEFNRTSDWHRLSQPDINDTQQFGKSNGFMFSEGEIPRSKEQTPAREKDSRPPMNPRYRNNAPQQTQLKDSKRSVEAIRKPQVSRNEKPAVRQNTVDNHTKLNQSMNGRQNGSTSVNGRANSPLQKEKKKELKFQARQRVDSVITALEKQPGPNLELIGLEIKDSYIPDIFQFIKKNERHYGLIKFVKNELTNEGIASILHYLKNDKYAHTLNLTSNHLTEDCLDSIIEFLATNKVLKNFYLTGNNINTMKARPKKKAIQQMGVSLYL